MSDRLSKEELKEDRVATAAMQAVDYARKNARWVIAAVGLMVACLVVVIVVVQTRTKANREASLALLRAQAASASGSYAEALPQLEALAGKYGSTAAGRHGRLYLGAAQLASGNAAGAEQTFRKFLASHPSDRILESAGRRGLAGSLADQGKFDEGANEYRAAARIQDNPLAAEDLLQAGVAFQQAGKRDAAIQAYQEVATNHPRSSVVSEARVRLKELLSASGS